MDNYTSSSFFARITELIYNQRDYSNLKEILAEITREARAIIEVDRIQIYQFAPDGSG
jgi:light-regulated signal transduction histidine kinase (bacteriophytochrome)